MLSYAQEIKFWPSIEMGYEDRQMSNFIYSIGKSEDNMWLKNMYYTTLQLDVSYRNFVIYSDTKTNFKPITLTRYSPRQVSYTLGLGYQYKQIYFKAEHMCSHSVDARVFREAINRISVRLDLFK